ncbi:MAG: hypothetical protein M1587_10720 [Thaumarchaeota archaeon]|nr:hypothetical protein [Nitrososphaerota archaeon]MDG6907260.1 hypothetical protein [Nitrososphaerota archaeon]
MSARNKDDGDGMADRQMFLEKAARSIAELQPKIATLAETVVFLEVLGYTNKMASDHGFQDLADLARHVLQYTGLYDTNFGSTTKRLLPVPNMGRRTAEAFGVAYPWAISYVVLLVFGVSLWLARILPLDLTTSFVVGIYSGLLISGGMGSFGRLFSFYDSQLNFSEVRRLLKRFYSLLAVILIAASLGLYAVGSLWGVPSAVVAISIVSSVTLSAHMASYMIIYNKRRFQVVVYSYSAALVALLSVYFLGASVVPDVVSRYFYALGTAVLVLSIPAVYFHYLIFRTSSIVKKKGDEPSFYSPASAIKNTLKSNFGIQMWEILPYFVYGVLFFCLLFGDRLISWIYNPVHVINGVSYFLVFNTPYHLGADSALMALFPSLIIQYAMLSSLHSEINNISLASRISDADRISRFLASRYKNMMAITIAATAATAAAMMIFEPSVLTALSGSSVSSFVFDVALIANVFMAIFAGNALFLTFMNKIKAVCLIGIAAAGFLLAFGLYIGMDGFQYIVYAYLGETILLAVLSTAVLLKYLGKITSIFFSRYV